MALKLEHIWSQVARRQMRLGKIKVNQKEIDLDFCSVNEKGKRIYGIVGQ